VTLRHTNNGLKFLIVVRKVIPIVPEFEVIGEKLNITHISHFTNENSHVSGYFGIFLQANY